MAVAPLPTLADLARLDAILKDKPLQDGLQEAINKATPFMERITQVLSLSGRKGIFPVSFGVNEGIYARADKGVFGDSQVDAPVLAEVTAKFIYALFEISGPTMSATRESPGAFEEALSLSLEKTIDGLKLDMNRMVIGDGTGTIALVQSVTDTDTIVVDSPFGLSRYKSDGPVRNIIRKNMPLDTIDVTAPPATLHGENMPVSGITHAAGGTTLDFSVTDATLTNAADGDFVARQGNYGLEIEGWLAAVDTAGSYLNITRAGNDGWQGQLIDAADGGAVAVSLDPTC